MSPGRRPSGDEEAGAPPADRTPSSEPNKMAANGGERRSTEQPHGSDSAGRDIPTHSGSTEPESLWTRFRTANDGPLLLLREVLLSGGIVLLFGLLLFGASGVWPPMVAVESESMEPNINQYDLIVVSEPGRFAPETADRTGVVTAGSVAETEHESFNRAGSVIVYQDPDSFGPPIIHRAHFYVEDGENWYDQANPEYITADSCSELNQCPAPHAGYITKGDNTESNAQYDQANGIAPVVKPGWVTGVAQLRIPWAGYIRLALTGAASFGPLLPAGVGAIGAGTAYAVGRRELLQ